jgi:predicted membrane-bound spermidine synthase
MTLLLCVVFFLSGAAALLFETLWFHQASLAFGSSVWASSLVLAGFMGGLAVGNGAIGRLGHRIARPVAVYAALEGVIAVAGVALVHGLPALGPLFAPLVRAFEEQPWALQPLRLGLAFALLLVPSTAMGATLPLLVTALYRRDPHFGRVLGRLYGWNTAGAVAGALAGEAFLVAWLGIRGAALAAALANATALVLALGLARSLDAAGAAARPPPPAPLPRRSRAVLAAAFAFGGILLALEVVWFRLLLLKILGSSLAFAALLSVVLAGIALGGLAGAAWLSRAAGAARALPAVALVSGALCVLTFAQHGRVLAASEPGSIHSLGGVLTLALPLMFPVCLLSGALFTLCGDALHREGAGETRAAGLLALANTTGAMLGSLAGGFVLLPGLGVEGSIRALAGVYVATGLALALAGAGPRRAPGRAVLAAAAVLAVAALALFPTGRMHERYLAHAIQRWVRLEGARPVAVREGTSETAVYLESQLFGQPLYHRLVTNGYSMSGTSLPSLRYMKLFVWLPVAVHPDPRSALLISYGVGSTAKALTDTRSLERIDVVDISRDILELASIVYPDPAEHPLRDPRVRVHVEDGRHFLQTTDRRFDLITAEPPPPKAAGVVNLYTREYFALLRARLAEGGIASYWLPVHGLLESDAKAIVRGFCDAFPDCSLWAGAGLDWILLGTRGARGPVSEERFRAQWRDPVVGPALQAVGIERPEQLGALFLFGADDLAERLAGVAPLADDHPKRLSHRVLGSRLLAPTWLPWLEPTAARQRFAKSELAARLWPLALRESSLAWFDARAAAERHLLGAPRGALDLSALHARLEDDPLRALPLWELGSDALRQRAARAAAAQGRATPEVERELALGALAERDFAAAATGLARAGRNGDSDPQDARLEVYALCRAGAPDAARARARELGLGASAEDRALSDLLRRAIDPRCAP